MRINCKNQVRCMKIEAKRRERDIIIAFSNGGVHGGPTDMWEREREVEEEDNG